MRFYHKEVYNYVGKETIILTIIGILLGLGGGYFLTTYIIKTCELDMLMFNPQIQIMSYIYGILITAIFTIIVSIGTYFALKKIDMIESLKSVE
ncbi:MAG: FtsX-like permease family protein [Intestinibacter sp.]